MNNVVFESQSAFVADRVIHDNVIRGFEGLHCMRKNRFGDGSKLAMKIDMAKTCDRIEWCFIEHFMER